VALPAGLAGLVLIAVAHPDAVPGLSFVVVGAFAACGAARALAGYFAAPLVAVALGSVAGAVLGCVPALVVLAVFLKEAVPHAGAVIGGFMMAGALLGAVAGAARRGGTRANPGVYRAARGSPAVEVPALGGPPLRLTAAQLRALADQLDRHGRTVRLRPLAGQPTADADPPPV
jgi:hypothetical protein